MFDAYNAIDRQFTPYLVEIRGPQGASIDAAVGQAAHDTLAALFPQQKADFDEALRLWLADVPDGRSENQGVALGRTVARLMLNARKHDGSDDDTAYTPGTEPGNHQVDPLHPEQGFLTPNWGKVDPFAIGAVEDFIAAPPPEMNSQEYADAFQQVYELGAADSTARTEEQTEIGLFWAYDGAPGLGTPPRLYNQITREIALEQGNTEAENARLFALVNIAMADAGIASWATKYEYNFWRPIVAIRNADADGNEATVADADWTPLGAPASNAGGTDFTPPFPAYTSGHATFGAATFSTIAHFYGTDDISFTFTSDELNGVTTDANGLVRPAATRSFDSLSEAAWENALSRIYLGIHWSFDATAGVEQGNAVADAVFSTLFQPLTPKPTPGHAPPPAHVAGKPADVPRGPKEKPAVDGSMGADPTSSRGIGGAVDESAANRPILVTHRPAAAATVVPQVLSQVPGGGKRDSALGASNRLTGSQHARGANSARGNPADDAATAGQLDALFSTPAGAQGNVLHAL
jgi:hypothetical protein